MHKKLKTDTYGEKSRAIGELETDMEQSEQLTRTKVVTINPEIQYNEINI